MFPHRIRLNGPWQLQPVAREGQPTHEPVRVAHPCRWADAGLVGFAGTVRHVRRFGKPGILNPGEHVWLTGEDVAGSADVSLNGVLLGTVSGPFEFPVTPLLFPRNEIVIAVTAASDSGGLPGEVALEIRASAWLRGVARHEADIIGEVVGEADGPLDLYVLSENEATTHRHVGVGPFAVPVSATASGVRVELVCGGVVWGTVRLE